ncbi:MAG: LysR family transcriptional regulator substrate-binding protein [Lachnospiraceae bacterium]|nr:LysR family transcriptional regulator substrate-binding protein [Lachnospiraceae bacterium]
MASSRICRKRLTVSPSFSSVTALFLPQVIHYFRENYPKVEVEIMDGNYDEIRDWIIHGQVDCGFLSSIVADNLKFYPLWDDPLCALLPEDHPLAKKESVTLPELFRYPLIIETPGCDNDIQHLMRKCPVKPDISYSFRDDPIIMSFVRNGLGVTISQELVLKAFGQPGVVSRPLKPACCRTIGLAFSKTPGSVVSQTLLMYLQKYSMV